MVPEGIVPPRPRQRGRHIARGYSRLRRLAAVVLLTFVASVLVGTVVQALDSSFGLDRIAHSDGAPCPDPTDGDHPCGPACPCACCHVMVVVPEIHSIEPSLWLPAITAIAEHISDDLYPQELAVRVFHPPRV